MTHNVSSERLAPAQRVVTAPADLDSPAGKAAMQNDSPFRIAMVLCGIGRIRRGAEAAFLELARAWSERPGLEVTLFGSGTEGIPDKVRIHSTRCRPRESFEGWPRMPGFRTEMYYEEFSYARHLARSKLYRATDYDVTVHCSFPWINWYLRRAGRKARGQGARLVYVTQNGDWPCHADKSEYRYFACDGLVCTNPEYYERNKSAYRSVLIPNGVDTDLFHPAEPGAIRHIPELDEGDGPRPAPGQPVVLIASAQAPSKLVPRAIEAMGRVPEAFVAVAGEGSERDLVAQLAHQHLAGRHRLLGSVFRPRMPDLFRRANAFLHMSQTEPSALVYVEAASSGLPLIVHDSAVTRWTLGDAAVYTDTSDLDQTAAAVRTALEPGRAAQLGTAARQRVLDGWSWRHLAEQYETFFRELARSSSPKPLA